MCAYRLYPLWRFSTVYVLLLSDHKRSPVNAADLFSHQEKLAKSIHYLISKEDQVRIQITELEVLISQTEVRELTHAAATPASSIHSTPEVLEFFWFWKSLLSHNSACFIVVFLSLFFWFTGDLLLVSILIVFNPAYCHLIITSTHFSFRAIIWIMQFILTFIFHLQTNFHTLSPQFFLFLKTFSNPIGGNITPISPFESLMHIMNVC